MLFEQVAHNLEINMVAVIGRNDLKLGPLCNLTDAGEGISGYRHTIETKEKIRLSLIGRNKGIERTNEVKEKISKANLGRILSEETKKRIGIANKGKILSSETRERCRQASIGQIPWNKGKTNVYSAESRQKMSECQKGEKSFMYGKHLSEETKKKISKTMKRYKEAQA